MKLTLICSAATKERLQELINDYHYSSSYRIQPDNTVHNINGLFAPGKVKEKKGRFYYYIQS